MNKRALAKSLFWNAMVMGGAAGWVGLMVTFPKFTMITTSLVCFCFVVKLGYDYFNA